MACSLSVVAYTVHRYTSPSDISPSRAHWGFLLSQPQTQPTPTRRNSILPSTSQTTKVTPPVLFDRHNHQLRLTSFPTDDDTDEQSSTPGPSQSTITPKSIPALPDQRPLLRIILPFIYPPSKSPKERLNTVLYSAPTYGSEYDWLRTSLKLLSSGGLLESSFDIDAFLVYAEKNACAHSLAECESFTTSPQDGTATDLDVPVLDYVAHLRSCAELKAMTAPHGDRRFSSATTARSNSPNYVEKAGRNGSVGSGRSNGSDSEPDGKRRWCGLWFTKGSSTKKPGVQAR